MGEYGHNWEDPSLIIDAHYYFDEKYLTIQLDKAGTTIPKGKKYKYQVIWIGKNCCKLIKVK